MCSRQGWCITIGNPLVQVLQMFTIVRRCCNKPPYYELIPNSFGFGVTCHTMFDDIFVRQTPNTQPDHQNRAMSWFYPNDIHSESWQEVRILSEAEPQVGSLSFEKNGVIKQRGSTMTRICAEIDM
jgi:hypothetical protein